MTPAGVVAVKLLRALRVETVDEAKGIVAMWAARPRLAPADIRAVLAEFDHTDECDPAGRLPDGIDGRSTEEFGLAEMPPRHVPPRSGEHESTGGPS